jgi:hypothetical protein
VVFSMTDPFLALYCNKQGGQCLSHVGTEGYVAEWLEVYLGIVVPEYGVPRKETETFWEWRDVS